MGIDYTPRVGIDCTPRVGIDYTPRVPPERPKKALSPNRRKQGFLGIRKCFSLLERDDLLRAVCQGYLYPLVVFVIQMLDDLAHLILGKGRSTFFP